LAAPGLWFAVTCHVAARPSCCAAASNERLRALIPYVCLIAISLGTSQAYAQDTSTPPVELPEVVVGATRLPTPESELGTSVTVITSDEIAAKQERMLPDALLDVSWVNK
jgi:vitamin B12 transporter